MHFFQRKLEADKLWDLPDDPGCLGYVVIRPSALGTVGRTMLVPPPGLKDAVRTQVTEAVEWLYGHIEHIPAEDRVGIGVVRIGDAAVAYETNWLADLLDYATSDADRAEAWAFFPTGCDG